MNDNCLKLAEILPQIIYISIRSYPNECCGIILNDFSIQPAFNAVSSLHHPALNSQNSFLIDSETLNRVSKINIPILAIYHSHTNGVADMSEYDQHSLKSPDLYSIIIGIKDHKFTVAKLHLYDAAEDCFLSKEIIIGD